MYINVLSVHTFCWCFVKWVSFFSHIYKMRKTFHRKIQFIISFFTLSEFHSPKTFLNLIKFDFFSTNIRDWRSIMTSTRTTRNLVRSCSPSGRRPSPPSSISASCWGRGKAPSMKSSPLLVTFLSRRHGIAMCLQYFCDNVLGPAKKNNRLGLISLKESFCFAYKII